MKNCREELAFGKLYGLENYLIETFLFVILCTIIEYFTGDPPLKVSSCRILFRNENWRRECGLGTENVGLGNGIRVVQKPPKRPGALTSNARFL